jgi:cytochrome c
MKKMLLVAALLLAACKRETNVNNGDIARGKQLLNQYGCGSCHSIPGVPGATGMVGPPLDHMAVRQTLAGKYANTPEVMSKWLQNPQAMDPANTMPNLGVTPDDARDLTAFLFTLK